MADFIRIKDLRFTYAKEENSSAVDVLCGVDLDIKKGEYVAILGRNGSGKSTLAKLLNLVIDDVENASGSITVDGIDVLSEDMTEDMAFELRKKIGMVFQNPDNQLVATIVEEDVAFGPENLGLDPKEIRRRVDAALATVGMTEFAKREPHRLSGGQKQRVAIAGVIAMMPECIIFDESTAMLDPIGRKEIVATMEKLNREHGITVLTITHYMEEAVRADRVVVLNEGKVALQGTPAEVFSNARLLRDSGLELPQCAQLLEALSAAGFPIKEYGITPEDCARIILAAGGAL
ncbi:MAG: energy-coupling factor transporter ATPase [Clostridia bacterium]|nr:energy-coupling factor transporter ATPase [Clostridia bacterium]MBO7296769.1 energy-coupling factor transporter ATPase [Clostridia bacterium]